LFPFYENRHLAGRAATWSPPTFHEEIADVVNGRRLYDKVLARLVIAGWIFVVAVGLRGRRWALIPCAIAAASFVAVQGVRGVYPNDVTSQMPWRALTSIGVIALVPAAMMIATVTDWIAKGLRRVGERARPVATVARHHLLVAEVLGVTVCMFVVFGVDHRSRLDGELAEPIPEMRQTAQVLHALVPVTARFAVEEDFPAEIGRLGVIAPARWLAWASGRDELNIFNPELNRGAAGYAAREIRTTDTGLAFHLATLGVTHVVSTSAETATRLGLSQEMTLLETHGPLRIWQINAASRAVPRALVSVEQGSVNASYERRSNEHHQFSVDVTEHTAVGIAIADSPRWKLTVDGHSVALARYSDGRIKLELDAGRHNIRLDYGTDWRTIVGGIVSILSLIYAARILWWMPRQKISDATPA
jgi:hypothetical protein